MKSQSLEEFCVMFDNRVRDWRFASDVEEQNTTAFVRIIYFFQFCGLSFNGWQHSNKRYSEVKRKLLISYELGLGVILALIYFVCIDRLSEMLFDSGDGKTITTQIIKITSSITMISIAYIRITTFRNSSQVFEEVLHLISKVKAKPMNFNMRLIFGVFFIILLTYGLLFSPFLIAEYNKVTGGR